MSTAAIVIASIVAAGWLLLVFVLITFLLAHQRRAELEAAARTAVCAVASAEEFITLGESKHEAAARLAAELDPDAFAALSDLQKSTLIAAAYFTEVVRRSRMWPIVTLPQGIT